MHPPTLPLPSSNGNGNGHVAIKSFDRHLQEALKDALRGAAEHFERRASEEKDKKKSADMAFNSRRCYSAIGDINRMRSIV